MPIMKWNTPPKGTEYDRRAHDGGHGDNVALQHAVSGNHVQGGGQVNTLGENVAPAHHFSTAPYKGDNPNRPPTNPYGYRDKSRQGKCMANDDTCNGSATKATDFKWCNGHAMSMAKKAE